MTGHPEPIRRHDPPGKLREGPALRLAASNIAWEPAEDDAVAAILRARGFTGVEIAPTKRWPAPLDATKQEIAAYRAEWEQRGLKIVAMQALLFGRPDLQLFGSNTIRRALAEYLDAIIELGHGLGATALVFGSPKNRHRGELPLDEALEIATGFFADLGARAAARDIVICIEPNPPEYGCDFITTTHEAVELCRRIDSPGVRVNGDVAAMSMAGEDVARMVQDSWRWFAHVHASEPSLAAVSDTQLQAAAGEALRASGYEGWVSIEMRGATGSSVEAVSRATDAVARLY